MANSPDFRQKQRSQWSTQESGPLAHAKMANTPSFRQKQRSQWTTRESGPLAQTKMANSPDFRQKQRSQWTTRESGPLAHAKPANSPWFPAKTKEPVDHSGKWTTSSRQTGEFPLVSGKIRGASGPLGKVDHWLPQNRRLSLVSIAFCKSQALKPGPAPR